MTALGLCLLASSARAQFYLSGEDPAGLSWSQVKVGPFKLIYPKDQDSLAAHYAALLCHDINASLKGLDAEPRRRPIPVLLHTYSAAANGMVAWTPQRMELFTIPSPEVSNLDWSRSLVLHEGRHVAQMLRAGGGVFRTLHYLLGEQSEGVAAAYYDYFSPGFFEGDAVMAESEYSQGGRGRQADFLLPYKAYFADSVNFSYDKWHFGSYKHYIPNEYALGYLKWTAGRAMNRAALQDPSKVNAIVFDEISLHPFRYRRAYQQAYGMSLRELWPAAEAFYREYSKGDVSRKSESSNHKSPIRVQTPANLIEASRRNDYEKYSSLQVLRDGRLLVCKNSLSQSSRVELYNPKEKSFQTLFLMGSVNSPVRASDTHLYWTEIVPHPRWTHLSYSLLCTYDLSANAKIKRPLYLSKKSLYFNPSPSKDNRYLAFVEADINAGTRLLVLRIEDMQVLLSIPMPAFDELKEIAWSDDNSYLYLSLLNADGLRLEELDLARGTIKSVIAPQHRIFSHISHRDGTLYFDAEIDGSSQIYAYHLQTKTLQQLTHARFGAKEPLWYGDSLYVLDYSTKGWHPAVLSCSEIHPIPASFEEPTPFLIDELLAAETTNHSDIQQPSETLRPSESISSSEQFPISENQVDFSPKPYHKWTHLFKFHSWSPLYYDKDQLESFNSMYYYESVAPGLSLFTQNELGTAYGQLGYSYHEGYHAAHARFTYSGFMPVFSLSADYNDATSYSQFIRNDTLFTHSPKPAWKSNLNVYLPLTYRRGAYNLSFIPSAQWHLTNTRWYSEKTKRYEFNSFLVGRFQANISRDRALRDIKSPLFAGMNMALALPTSRELYYSLQTLLSVYGGTHTGLLPNDILAYRFSVNHCFYNRDTRFILDPMLSTRGFDDVLAQNMNHHVFEYTFPCNLDWSVPGWVYIKRLETTLFAEVMDARQTFSRPAEDLLYRSIGAELSFNLHPFRTNFNLNMGFRTTLSEAPQGSGVEMILSVPYL